MFLNKKRGILLGKKNSEWTGGSGCEKSDMTDESGLLKGAFGWSHKNWPTWCGQKEVIVAWLACWVERQSVQPIVKSVVVGRGIGMEWDNFKKSIFWKWFIKKYFMKKKFVKYF